MTYQKAQWLLLLPIIVLFVSLTLSIATPTESGKKEKDYQLAWASQHLNAQTEVVTKSGARCDILTPEFAIEVDYSKKWAESLGQSLLYAAELHRRAGILLIGTEDEDQQFYDRLLFTIQYHRLDVTIWRIAR